MNTKKSELFGPINPPDPLCRYNFVLNSDEPVQIPGGPLVIPNVPNPFGTHAEGYKELADLGVEHTPDAFSIGFVYPIIFCYRQYLELRLKQLLVIVRDYFEEPQEALVGHSLKSKWTTLRPLLERISKSAEAAKDFDKVCRVLTEFDSIDGNSESFRYPVDRNGNRMLPGRKTINVKRVQQAIEGISPTLDGASYMIEHLQDRKDKVRGAEP